jgi:hypothetical protein
LSTGKLRIFQFLTAFSVPKTHIEQFSFGFSKSDVVRRGFFLGVGSTTPYTRCPKEAKSGFCEFFGQIGGMMLTWARD